MKLQELHQYPPTLEEGLAQRAIAAAALVIGTLYPSQGQTPTLPPEAIAQLGAQRGANTEQLAADVVNIISTKYKVKPELVEQIVEIAKKYEHPDFPRAKDILAVISVESSFNPNAVSKLKRDPARGLMQVRPMTWKLPKESLATIDGQIKHGAQILRQYYVKLGDKEAALHAYNVGLTNHYRAEANPKKGNPRYVPKILAARADLLQKEAER